MPSDVQAQDTVIIGGGQAGLAMSYLLTQRGREHVILDKQDEVGASWRRRWDSFTLVTPNWTLRLPGHMYDGDNPDGYLQRDEVVDYLKGYARKFEPPIRHGVTVEGVVRDPHSDGWLVRTTPATYRAKNVVAAVGTFQTPRLPACHARVPAGIKTMHSLDYKNPESIPDGAVLVVGSGQSGCQIAKELHERGRDVFLCVGSAWRLPRRYRGKDGVWWLDKLGLFDQTPADLDSPAMRFAANPHASGRNGGEDINLHAFARDGITLLGHLEDIRDGLATLGQDLHERLAAADKATREVLKAADAMVERDGLDLPEEQVDDLRDGFDQPQRPTLDLAEAGVGTVIWATGFGWDYSWIDAPILDDFGYPIQKRGVTDHPGLYFVGLHFMETRRSGIFLGVGDDAEHIARDMEKPRAD